MTQANRPLHALVLGLGDSGLSMARWCVAQGWSVTAADTRPAPPRLQQLHSELPQVEFIAGPFDIQWLDTKGVQAVFKSPGLAPAQVEPVWGQAQGRGLWCSNELGLFVQDRKSTRLNSSHEWISRMPSSA